MSVELNLLVLMSESSDYKPVVPVGGCDNVLKSLKLTAHTHLRETRLPRADVFTSRAARVFAWARLYLHQYSGHICLRNVSLSGGGGVVVVPSLCLLLSGLCYTLRSLTGVEITVVVCVCVCIMATCSMNHLL